MSFGNYFIVRQVQPKTLIHWGVPQYMNHIPKGAIPDLIEIHLVPGAVSDKTGKSFIGIGVGRASLVESTSE